ncbi:MAG: 30S ribosomal protein S2 [Ardenticatenaceae bacterium]|nr:30S ribosomal protein S2 [Ardenticatenaceae bacterium]
MPVVSMKSLLETGVHFGHRTRRWNPKMRPYIFTERNGIHILDLQQTIVLIDDAYKIIRDIVANGGSVLFVGTKRQALDTIAREAARAQQPYINTRWLGGTLTNWVTIRQRINHLDQLEAQQANGDFEGLKKRERLMLEREIDKLNLRLGGIRTMRGLPDALFIVDVNHEETAVREANKLNIPIIGVVDTNCDPDLIDHVIPSNDDAIRAIKLIVGKMADAALEGLNVRMQELVEEDSDESAQTYSDFDGYDDDVDEADLLGEATLAKIRQSQPAPAVEEAAPVEVEVEAAVASEEAAVAEAEAPVEAEAPAEVDAPEEAESETSEEAEAEVSS